MTTPPSLRIIQPLPDARPKEEVHAKAMAQGAQCTICPLYGCGRGPVMDEIREDALLTIVAEAPGATEVDVKRPLVGWSGQKTENALAGEGVTRSQVSLLNSILCQPGDGAGNYTQFLERLKMKHKRAVRAAERAGESPPPEPVLPGAACRPRLVHALRRSASTTVLAMGKKAMESLCAIDGVEVGAKEVRADRPYVATIKHQHGAPVRMPSGYTMVVSYHPAMAAREKREFMPVIIENIQRAVRIARRGGASNWTSPPFDLRPTPEQVEDWCARAMREGYRVSVDIETNSAHRQTCHIRCVQVATIFEGRERVIVVPFRHMDGSAWWARDEDKMRCALALQRLLHHNPVIGQNFQFDSGVTARKDIGLLSRDVPWDDTLIAHSNTDDNDLPHDLGFIARRYFEVPVWKGVNHKSVDNIDDQSLHYYGGMDVLTVHRLWPKLQERMQWCGTRPQYETGKTMAPILRDMSDLGMFCDEHKRGEYAEFLKGELHRLREDFQSLVGKRVNPNSPQQLQTLLYEDWGLEPRIGTDGYEYDEEKSDPSTSVSAIMALLRHDASVEQARALNALLDFRRAAKLDGTYVRNLPAKPVDWAAVGPEYAAAVDEAVPVYAYEYDAKKDQDIWREVIGARAGLSVVHPTLNNHVVPTGRLSSNGPNCQNIPALGLLNMRDMYVAPPFHSIVGADWDQLEARIYAVEAQDQLLLETIHKGLDIHSMNAATLFATHPSQIPEWYERIENGKGIEPSKRKAYRKNLRTIAKRFCFLIIYGGERDKLYSVMAAVREPGTNNPLFANVTPEMCLRWYDNWHAHHPETHRWHLACHAEQRENGYVMVPALDYRKRFFLGGVSKKNAVPNMKIQGFAAAIANKAIIQIHEAIPHRGWSHFSGLWLQVHDDIKVYAPTERAEEAAGILKECMETERGGVRFTAEPVISQRWAEQDV